MCVLACNAFCGFYQSRIDKIFKYVQQNFLSSFINPEKIIHSILVKMTTDSEGSLILKQKNKGGRPLGTIWEDINQG